MAISPRKHIGDYWEVASPDSMNRSEWIASRIGRDRFMTIHHAIQFKIDFVLPEVCCNFVRYINRPTKLCLDESFVLSKSYKNPFRVVIPMKPGGGVRTKIFNIGCRLGKMPVLLAFLLSRKRKETLVDSINSILDLLPQSEYHHYYADKWFNSHDSTEAFLNHRQDITGILNRSRYHTLFKKRFSHLYTDADSHIARSNRVYKTKGPNPESKVISVTAVRFNHIKPKKNKVQAFMSTVTTGEEVAGRVDTIEEYSANKRSVDYFDQKVRYIEHPHKNGRWAFLLLMFAVNAAIVNSAAIYAFHSKQGLTTLQATKIIASALAPQTKVTKSEPEKHKLIRISEVS